ncbi:MAG: S1 RNA-binding domain-containing protein [Candidatus Aenigmarchaeota archaeon]|nr:S1 RNA-binding domain-containing protein [Candidatus Aenigmarchaeota archaeon]
MKKEGWPKKREIVVGTVIRINPHSVIIRLEEYNKEAMIHVSELARRFVKNIKDVVKKGQLVVATVMDVDKDKGHITLSLKRINKYDADAKLKEYKREKKAESILSMVAKSMKSDIDTAYEKAGFKLKQEYGELFHAFQQIAEENDVEKLIKLGIDKKWADKIIDISKKQFEAKEKTIKMKISLICPEPDGINKIKNILESAIKKYKINISYISAPEYSLEIKTKKLKEGDKTLKSAAQFIINKITKIHGSGYIISDQ